LQNGEKVKEMSTRPPATADMRMRWWGINGSEGQRIGNDD